MTSPAPDVVENKVKVAALVTLLASIAVSVLNAVQDTPSLLAPLPPLAQTLVLLVVPPVLTFLAGYVVPSNRV